MHTPTTVNRPRTFEAIVNAGSGTVQKLGGPDAIAKVLRSPGAEVRLTVAGNGSELSELAGKAANSDADVVIAAGGDGTISGVASKLIGTGKTLGVIPLGTFNFFARRLGIPLELTAAARNVFEGRITEVTTGQVNGRPFLNKASVGLYPLAVRFRERMYDRYGRNRIVAILAGAFALLRRGHVMTLRLQTENEDLEMRSRFVFVCNNPEELKRLNIRGRECLERDRFAIFVPKPLSPLRMLGLGIRLAMRRVHDATEYDAICARELHLVSKRRRLPVSLDGEVQIMPTPLHFAVQPKSLKVIVPNP
jgi:diacylglycerol kinase family enzyme